MQKYKKIIKSFIPPLFLNKMSYIKNYIHFLRYKDLIIKNSELKDIHRGKRCFILGSAPSIKKENLKPLKNEIVIAMNNFYVHEDFLEIMNGNVQKYYIVAPIHPPQTEVEWKMWFEDMERHVPINTIMVFGLTSYRFNIKYILEKYGLFRNHTVYWYFAGIPVNEYYKFKESHICFHNMVWAASSVSTYALLLALYMGFDNIYLLGVDHNYVCIEREEEYRFYKSSIHQQKEHERMNFKKSDEFFATGKVFLEKEIIAEMCKTAKIYNCSKESLLNMFEKIDFSSLF